MVQAEFTIRKEGGPALDDPVFLVEKVVWRLPLARRKVEIGNLVTIVIQEYFWVGPYLVPTRIHNYEERRVAVTSP